MIEEELKMLQAGRRDSRTDKSRRYRVDGSSSHFVKKNEDAGMGVPEQEFLSDGAASQRVVRREVVQSHKHPGTEYELDAGPKDCHAQKIRHGRSRKRGHGTR